MASGTKFTRLASAKRRLIKYFPKYAEVLSRAVIIDGPGNFRKGTVYGSTNCVGTIWIDTEMHNSEESIMTTLAHEVKHNEKHGGDCGQIDAELRNEGIYQH